MHEINRKMATGAAWMVLFKFTERGLGVISTVVLARLLLPADFGLVAMAMAIIAVSELMGAFGFDMALIRNQDAARREFDTAWTCNILLGAGIALVVAALAVPAAVFFDTPQLRDIMRLLALLPLMDGLENIGVVMFRKEMDFRREFVYQFGNKLIGFAITIPLAFVLRNYWALVLGMLFSRAAQIALSYYMHAYRPRFSLSAYRELLDFSKWLLFNNLLFFLKNRSADFVIGRMSGPMGLGLYAVAFQVSNLPTTELVAPINRAVFPGYAKLSGNLSDLRRGYLNVIGVITVFALPAGVGIAAIADPLVRVFLGGNWTGAIPLIQVLALFGVFTAVQTNMGPVFLALGKPSISTYLAAAYVIVLLPLLIWLTSRHGAIGATFAYLATVLILLPVNFYVVFRRLDVRAGQFLSQVWRPVVATVAMALVVWLYLGFTGAETDSPPVDLLRLGVAVPLGAFVYIMTLLILWLAAARPEGIERNVLDQVWPPIRTRFFSGDLP